MGLSEFRAAEAELKAINEMLAKKFSGQTDVETGPDDIIQTFDGKYLYYCKPIKSKSVEIVLPAIQEVVSEIGVLFRANVVHRIHGDRAQELVGSAVRDWAYNEKIFISSTAGSDPNANSRAERAVGVLKISARTLLLGCKFGNRPGKFWALAMHYYVETTGTLF